jgi:8-oxo-dGTP diphosphatase
MQSVVVAAVIERDGEILICQRKSTQRHPLKWEFPGGKVVPGEAHIAAIERELEEELGIRASIGPEIANYQYSYAGNAPIQLVFYHVTEFEGVMQNRVFAQICWEARERLPEYDFLEGDIAFVRDLASKPIEPAQE